MIDGFININKPKDFTSHDVVAVVRRNFRGNKVGHTGTLDPSATGVLVICVGKATKLQDYVMDLPKTYRAEIIFGITTDTLDMDGNIISRMPNVNISIDEFRQILPKFTGEISQVPPMMSAIKQNGVKLYKLAHKGIEVERKSRIVTIHSIDIVGYALEEEYPKVTIDIKCSKGTYIRTLADDMGEMLGCGAAINSLERLSSGIFNIEDSIKWEDISAMIDKGDYSFITPMYYAVDHLDKIVIGDKSKIRYILSGNLVPICGDYCEDKVYRIEDNEGSLIGLGHYVTGEGIKPDKILVDINNYNVDEGNSEDIK